DAVAFATPSLAAGFSPKFDSRFCVPGGLAKVAGRCFNTGTQCLKALRDRVTLLCFPTCDRDNPFRSERRARRQVPIEMPGRSM
ncbi:MAG TPA: hypothetical protein PKI05_15140, partial [Thermogutta sp.]|nr:hypothetical protein [Thermogutta sp.]